MKSLFINFLLKLSEDQLTKIEESQKIVGMSGSSVKVPHSVVIKLLTEDKKRFKEIIREVYSETI